MLGENSLYWNGGKFQLINKIINPLEHRIAFMCKKNQSSLIHQKYYLWAF